MSYHICDRDGCNTYIELDADNHPIDECYRVTVEKVPESACSREYLFCSLSCLRRWSLAIRDLSQDVCE